MMGPSKRSNSRAIGASAGEPHQPVSPRTLTNADALPGSGTMGGVGGTESPELGGGFAVTGIGVSTAVTGAVGELPPPQCVTASALPSRRATLNTGRRRQCIVEVGTLPGRGLTSEKTL